MTRKALILSLAFLFGINATVFCQNLLNHIPNDATFVTTFNPSALNAKIPFSKLKEFDFFKMSLEEIAKEMDSSGKEEMLKFLNDPSSYGVDLMASSYIFGRVNDEGNAFSYMFKLSDAAKFSQFFKSRLPADIEIISVDGFNIIVQGQDMAFAWSDDFALITGVEVPRQYDLEEEIYYGEEDTYIEEEDVYYEEEEIIMEEESIEPPIEDMEIIEPPIEEMEIVEPPIEEMEIVEPPIEELEIVEEEIVVEEIIEEENAPELEGVEEEYEVEEYVFEDMDPAVDDSWVDDHAAIEREFTLNWVKMVMSSDGSASVMKNPKFMLANAKKTDSNIWLDYASVNKMYMDAMGVYGGSEMAMFTQLMGSMYADTYLSMGVNFDAGAVNFNVDTYTNGRMMKFFRESTDAKFNKKFHKYIPAENLMGYMNFNLNFENTVNGYKDIFMPMLNSIPMYGGMAKDLMAIMDVFIDEKAIYDLWDGDMFFAVTGLKDFERTITTYEFDEDFNRIETQQTVTQKLPEFLWMSSFNNEENVRKFMKLGESSYVMENKGSYYLVKIPEAGMDFYIALHKGIFFFTNNSDLIMNRLESGYSKKERMSKTHCQRIKDNSMVFYWDIPQSLNAASAFGIPMAGPQDKILNVSKDSFESIIWTTPKGGEQSINQSVSLNFVNKEMNSMEQIFNYINEVVMMVMGGSSM